MIKKGRFADKSFVFRIIFLLSVCVLSYLMGSGWVGISAMQYPDILRSVVTVCDTNSKQMIGSGFYISERLILTAAHVLVDYSNPDPAEKNTNTSQFRLLKPIRDIVPHEDFPIFGGYTPLKEGEKVLIKRVGSDNKEVECIIHYKDEVHDIAVLLVQDEDGFSPNYLSVKPRRLNYNEFLRYVGTIDSQPILTVVNVVNPRWEGLWSAHDDEGKRVKQSLILTHPGLGPGASGGALLDYAGRVVAIHVGRFYLFGIEIPLNAVDKKFHAAIRKKFTK